ncbi:MAG: hypothetical protein PHH36_05555 [Sideroxydans sp.]|nr:hypothetical protein [Sideroxydans sp.]
MTKEFQPVFTHLASDRPTFLFLGQDYLKLDNGTDAFLTSILSKYLPQNNAKEAKDVSYKTLLEKVDFGDEHSARAWISDTSRRLVAPQWLEVVSKMPWSGVYTTAIDTQLTRAFRTDWRDIQPIFSKKFSSPDPRSRTNLHITYVFGCIEREDDDERAPLNDIDLIRRSSDATILLSRLSEQVTPFGMLLIEGYQPESDWLGARDLATVLLGLEKGQAHFFSATELLHSNPLIKKLVQSGQVILHKQSLASVLNEGYASGVLSFEVRHELQKEGHYLSLGDRAIEVPDRLWTQTNRSAIVLEDAKLELPKVQSDERRYIAFRNFLADSGTKPIWSAYAAGFALERDFERDLFRLVQSRLKAKGASNDPIILHGQTGTGKSVALGALACRIRSQKQYSVLFIERRPQGPIAADLDLFCKWAEDAGFAATVLIWDGMIHIEQYTALLKNLLGRGRNVIVVGSTYKLEAQEADQRSLILAPSNLSDAEIGHFKALISQFEPSLGNQFESILKKFDTTFLVALYRLLPETRGQVKYGLQRETSVAEIVMKQQADKLEPEFAGGALAAAFQRSEILGRFEVLPEDKKEVGGEMLSATEELVGLIMVPGRFGLKVPIELVIRTLGRSRVANFHKIFESIDIFRWHADNQGNIFIGTRHPLEAKLICQVRLGGPRLEVEFAKKLLIEIDEAGDRAENTQIQFAADLLRNLGPNGPEKKLYASYYEDIASCLAKLRLERGVENPRIMLQEATLLREAVVAIQSDETHATERLALLDRATDTLKSALTALPPDSRTRRLRAMLLVELASTFGTKVREFLREGRSTSDVMDNFNEAKRYAYQARTLQPEDFFPIDVISWSTKDLIIGAQIDDVSRLDVIVDLLSMFESCDQESMSMRDKEIFNRRRVEFGTLLQDEVLKQDALDQLEAMGSRAGYYLNALVIAQEDAATPTITSASLQRISAAVKYLQDNYESIESDGRCLFLLLRYWWLMKAQRPIFGGERQLLPFDSKDWKYVISLLDRLMSLDDIYQTPMNSYLRAIGTWSLGYYHDANEIWKDLQRVSDSVTGRRRVAKGYVATNPDGSAALFSGTVDWVAEDGTRGKVFVEGVREKIDFFPRDFGLGDLRKGQALNNFCIAFNYIGPVVDPSHHAKS